MEINLDSATLNIGFPSCGKQLSQTIGRLKHQPDLLCACGRGFTVDLAHLVPIPAAALEIIDRTAQRIDAIGGDLVKKREEG